MNLKDALKSQISEPEPPKLSSRPEDAALIAELTGQITSLTSVLSKKDERITELQSELMMQQEQNALLTERASSVNKTESLNEKLNEQAAAAQALSDRKNREAKAAEERAERARASAQESEERKRKADQERWEAEQAKREAQDTTKRAQTRYKALFIAVDIYAALLTVLVSRERRSVFAEMGQWWVDRWHNIMSAGRGIGAAFMWVVHLAEGWGWYPAWRYVLAVGLALALLTGLFFLVSFLVTWIIEKAQYIKTRYHDSFWKATVTVTTALGLFFICLWFYEPIRAVWPFNIFSLWLALSAIGAVTWSGRELYEGLKYGR